MLPTTRLQFLGKEVGAGAGTVGGAGKLVKAGVMPFVLFFNASRAPINWDILGIVSIVLAMTIPETKGCF